MVKSTGLFNGNLTSELLLVGDVDGDVKVQVNMDSVGNEDAIMDCGQALVLEFLKLPEEAWAGGELIS